MEHFKAGEVVSLVVSVTENGYFVTVRWSIRFLQEGRSTTHRRDDLVRVTGGTP